MSEVPQVSPVCVAYQTRGVYEKVELISDQTMTGEVWKAMQVTLNRPVAIKLLKAEILEDETSRRKFSGEIQKLATLSHQNITAIIDCGEQDGRPFYVMEWIEGARNLLQFMRQLKEHFEQDSGNDLYRAQKDFRSQLLKVLEGTFTGVLHMHEHERAIIHMDLKPQNILLDTSNRPVVTDLGFAIDRFGLEPYSNVWGTYHYLHPELRDEYLRILHEQPPNRRYILIPRDKAKPQYDLYSLGKTLWHILSAGCPDEFPSKYELDKTIVAAMGACDCAAIEMIIGRLLATDGIAYTSCRQALEDLRSLNPSYSPVSSIPELSAVYVRGIVRLPELQSAPLSDRVRAIIDTKDFQRLRLIKQLALVDRVYPGASHTRFEHSLGCYAYAIRYVHSLLQDPIFRTATNEEDVRTLLAAALLHDVGHSPFSHVVEELERDYEEHIPKHEVAGRKIIEETEFADILRCRWEIDPERVGRLLCRKRDELRGNPVDALLHSILDSDIDVDKMDYLQRDSLHAGVAYGRHFDQERLFASLTVTNNGSEIAVTPKGRVPLEIFVAGRYWMFTEVYWHHTVRAISKMIKRAIQEYLDVATERAGAEFRRVLREGGDQDMLELLKQHGPPVTRDLVGRLFPPMLRRHHRRFLTLAAPKESMPRSDHEKLHERLSDMFSGRSQELKKFEEHLGRVIGTTARISVLSGSILVDIFPKEKDALRGVRIVEENPRRGPYMTWIADFRQPSSTSSAEQAFLKGVYSDFPRQAKKIRVFVARELLPGLNDALPTEESRMDVLSRSVDTFRS